MFKSSTTILLILFIAFIFIFASFDFVLADYRCTCSNTGDSEVYDIDNYNDCMDKCDLICSFGNGQCEYVEGFDGGGNGSGDESGNNIGGDSGHDIEGDVGQNLGGGDTSEKKQTSKLDNPLGTASIPAIIGKIIKTFLGIIGTISLVMFIYGGLLMLTSAGKSGQIHKGQQTLVWASLGILVVFSSYAILRFVFSAFGL